LHVVAQEGVQEGEESVDVVEGWPAAPFTEEEVFFLLGDEVIEDAEVDAGRISLNTAQPVDGSAFLETVEVLGECRGRVAQAGGARSVRTVTDGAQEDGPAVGDLGCDEGADERRACGLVVGTAVLLKPTWPKQTMPPRVWIGMRIRVSSLRRTATASPSLAR
jgi:hypothetical protein